MDMKRILLLVVCLAACLHLHAQLTLDECRRAARANYPLVRQYRLIEQSEAYTLSNAGRGNLPQVSLSGKVSYQSDATKLPFTLPDVDFHGLPKDQYQVMVEIQQNIWDGGVIRNRKQYTKSEAEEAVRRLDVSMYALDSRVDQIFFGILLLDEQLRQNAIFHDDLERNLHRVSACLDNGIAHEADVDAVQVEILNNGQQRIALETSRVAYVRMLALLMGRELEPDVAFERPELPHREEAFAIRRPELLLYEAQERTLDVRRQGLRSGYLPRFSLFAQGAYGNPGLNLLKDKFGAYYVVGARMSWNFGSLYTLKNDLHKLELERQRIDSERNLFLLDTHLQLAGQEGTISALRRQMEKDEEIIRLRANISRSAEVKVAEGTLSVTEMLRELTAENLARQTKVQHEVQLLLEVYKQKHLTN